MDGFDRVRHNHGLGAPVRRFLAIATALITAVAAWPSAQAWLIQAPPAASGTVQVLQAVVGAGSVTRWFPIGSFAGLSQTSDTPTFVVSTPGTFSNFNVRDSATPAGTTAVTIEKNGSTALTCNLTTGNQTCTPSGTTSFSAVAGDYLSLKIPNTDSGHFVSYSIDFTSTTAGETIIPSFTAGYSATIHDYQPFGGAGNPGNGASSRPWGFLIEGGTLSNYYVVSNDPTNASSTYTFAASANTSAIGSPTNYAIVLSAGCASPTYCSAHDTTNTATVTTGDYYNFNNLPSATAPVAGIAATSFQYAPTTSGHFPLISAVNNAQNASTIDYWALTGQTGVTATESQAQIYSNAETITSLTVNLSATPSSGTLTMTLNDNGTSSGASCTITSPATSCSMSGLPYTIAAGHLVDVEGNPGAGITNAPDIFLSAMAHR